MTAALSGWTAMRVVRKHTLPYHRKETLAEHTWGVLHLLLFIHPTASAELIRKAMYHDIGEYRAGDVPGDFKANNPDVSEACELVEREAAFDVLPEILHGSQTLTSEDVFLIKIADRMEFVFSCYHEFMLGNRYSVLPMERSLEMARDLVKTQDFVFSTLDYATQENITKLLNEGTLLLQSTRPAAASGVFINAS